MIVVSFLALIFLRNKSCWFDFAAAVLCLAGIFILAGTNVFNISTERFLDAKVFSYIFYVIPSQAFSGRLAPEDTFPYGYL